MLSNRARRALETHLLSRFFLPSLPVLLGSPSSYSFALILSLVIGSSAALSGQVSIWTRSNDLNRTASNLNETVLTPLNVNSASFGKLYTVNLDSEAYAQPLYVSALTIAGGMHDVVFVASMKNTVYAIDAPTGSILWKRNFDAGAVYPAHVQNNHNILYNGRVGILGTPVIDPGSNIMYFVSAYEQIVGANDPNNNIYGFHLNAIDITTGTPVLSPVQITASYLTPDLMSPIIFNARTQNQRAGLALANGNVYIAFGSHDDIAPYHGWVFAYSTTSLQQVAVFSDTTINSQGGIWSAGSAPPIDSGGNLYFSSGNGAFGPTPNGLTDTGNSMMKLSPTLQLLDYFTPYNSARLSSADQDLGSGGLLMLPGTNFLLGGGKQGVLYLVDTSNMGHFNSAQDAVRQEFQAVYGKGTSHIHGTPTYFESQSNGPTAYLWGENDVLRAYSFSPSTGLLNSTPFAMGLVTAPVTNNDGAMPGGFTSISANGKQNGIVWASTPYNDNAAYKVVQGVLYAYDAQTLNLLWSDKMQDARDEVGLFAKFCPPIVANGRMFVPTFGNLGTGSSGLGQLVAYGLLPQLTVTVANASMTGGSVLPALTGTVTGLASKDQLGSTIVVTYNTTATSASPAGAYPITATVTGASATNYNVTVNAGTLTISAPNALTVNVASANMTAGSALPALTGTVTGLAANDQLGSTIVVTYSTAATSTSPAGTYPITAAVTGSSAGNYTVAVNPGTLTISPANLPLTVNVASASMTPGSTLPTLTGTVTGLAANDQLGSTIVITYSTAATSSSPVGMYPITATVTGSSAGNYSVTVNPGTLTISPASLPLTVNVASASMTAGSALPALTGAVVGLAPNDQLGGTIIVTYTTAATSTSPWGTYAIVATVTGSSAGNYSVAVNAGILTITPKPILTVNVASATMTAGGSLPALIGIVTGLSPNDQLGSTVSVVYGTTASSLSPAGTYPITAVVMGPSAINYNVVVNPGTLTISPQIVLPTLTVNVTNASMISGGALPALTGAVVGLAPNDQLGSTIVVSYSTTATTSSAAGTFPITATVTGTSAINYSVIINPGTLTVLTPVVTLNSVNYPTGFAGSAMQLNGAAALKDSLLRLVSGAKNQTASAFYPNPVSVQAFTSTFTFQLSNASADGMAFVIQGVGPTALGGGSSSLGVGPVSGTTTGGIAKSAAIKFDLYSNAGEGPDSTGLYLNGAAPRTPAIDLTSTGIDLHSGHPMLATLNYNAATLSVLLTDTVNNATATQSYPVNLTSVVGSPTAYVGFTAATGGQTQTADILSWTYAPQTPLAAAIVYPTGSLSAKSTGASFTSFQWAGFPDGLGTVLNSSKPGNQVSFVVNVPLAGLYDIMVTSKQFNNRGLFQLYVDGVAAGPVADEYASNSVGVLKTFDLSSLQLGAGNHTFTFAVVGQNAASKGWTLNFGQLILTPQ